MCDSVRCRACIWHRWDYYGISGYCLIADLTREEREYGEEPDYEAVHEELLEEVKGKVVKVSELSQFVQPGVDVKAGDLVTFADAGAIRSADETPFGREVFQITVALPSGQKKLLTVNRTSMRNLAAKYGDDSEGWVGKKAHVSLVKQNVRGTVKDVIYLNPV